MANIKAYEVFKSIRDEPKNAIDLALEQHIAVQYLRNICNELEKADMIVKKRNGREVIYHVAKGYERDMPLFRTHDNQYRSLQAMATIETANTQAQRSLEFLPELAVKLLAIGYKFESLRTNIDPDSDQYRKQYRILKAELSAVKSKLIMSSTSLQGVVALFNNIKGDEDFWNLDELAKHYNNQIDKSGALIPAYHPAEIMEAYNEYRISQTEV
jgi:hypothetical protein